MKPLLHALFLLGCCLTAGVVNAQLPVEVTRQQRLSRQALQATLGGLPVGYGVEVYRITYTTPDVFGLADTASGLLVVPLPAGAPLAFPVAVYQHGTADSRRTIPSNPGVSERQVIYAFAAQGYITLAPDYLGLGESRGPHPYVHAETEASAAIDMLRAVRSYAAQHDIFWNGQLFLTGYSQGGHASMALHRALEQEHGHEFKVTAAAHLSGPYSISGVMRELILSDEPYTFPAYLMNTYLSYNHVYGLYDNPAVVFRAPYVPIVQAFSRGDIGLFEANRRLIERLRREAGAPIVRAMLQDSIVRVLAGQPEHPLNQALQDNDVYDWAPRAPTRLVYCGADEQVPHQNSVLADSIMSANGAPNVESVDVQPNANHGQCMLPAALYTSLFFSEFQQIVGDVLEVETLPRFYPAGRERTALRLRGLTEPAVVEILDPRGRRHTRREVGGNDGLVIAENLPAGIYFVKVTQNERVRTDRVVVP